MLKAKAVRTPLLMVMSMMVGVLLTSFGLTPYHGIFTSRTSSSPLTHDDLVEVDIPDEPLKDHDINEVHHRGEDVEAVRLAEKVRVLCWVMTQPETHQKKAVHVKATWGKRCNKLIFMSSQNGILSDKSLGAIDLDVGEGYNLLWGKTKAAFKYIYDHYLDDYEWVFKADDDTYTIMENMRYMLSAYDPDYPIYFGSRFKKFSKQGYMSGGGGYVLSREAVTQFVEVALPNKTLCKRHNTGAEDAEMGKCLDKIGVLAGDSRDSLGRGRFFPFTPVTHLFNQGLTCCSDTAITFHYMDINKMYEFEYLLYHLRPYGIQHHDPIPAPLPPDLNSIPRQILERRGKTDA
ncbi:Glycoprotein-N-acetylgalactosamine 3-beta-galactosyltransferase 1-like 8 [Homarus americanus]|uniref:Glycoprotein-N-acetylgalactosamine 3-beta-galactosyltransferase 1 n=1 Tax=Homarus americanus TaxID=6706 RepID=A0A8J5KFW0_HOMAM|nr:Glycoprotein-N-acetylgalactosamine 3-beta-galactosyltransferase 1-like 8 [Homarus americanus]